MVALVTGSSRGIGAAAAIELSKLGYSVAVNYKSNIEAAEAVVNKIKAMGGKALAFRADISKAEEVEAMFNDIEATLGNVTLLVNNAGVSHIGLLQDMSYQDILNLTEVDFLGTLYCTKRAIPNMVSAKNGCIINISSMWGEVGASCEVVYSACKAGIIGLTKALSKELGPCGIRVNCVSPGVITTEMNSELTKETLEELSQETSLLRLGTAEEIGKVIAFLTTESASYITGQIIPVNGGII